MKLLNGSELAQYIQERQARQVRTLRQAHKIQPKLAIILTVENPVIQLYVRLKKAYGAEIGVEVDVHHVAQAKVSELVKKLNKDEAVQGIIVQLPLEDPAETEKLVALVEPSKDVDALGPKAWFDPATPMAIMWLLAGYNINLLNKHIVLLGKGKLVGAPLAKIMQQSGLDVEVVGRSVTDLKATMLTADVIVTSTGQPAILKPNMIKESAVVVDAGVASEGGKTVGDLDPAVYERQDLTITPVKGGVGPLTVCALFENVIRAARKIVEAN